MYDRCLPPMWLNAINREIEEGKVKITPYNHFTGEEDTLTFQYLSILKEHGIPFLEVIEDPWSVTILKGSGSGTISVPGVIGGTP